MHYLVQGKVQRFSKAQFTAVLDLIIKNDPLIKDPLIISDPFENRFNTLMGKITMGEIM